VSECGRLRQGAGGHPGGDRRRSVLMLPTLRSHSGGLIPGEHYTLTLGAFLKRSQIALTRAALLAERFVATLALGLVMLPLTAHAQQVAKVWQIGYLLPAPVEGKNSPRTGP
jgi:hypothetical protein